ncbi:sugar phosphate isomerase/epimerase [Sphaerotilus hippei]|uniref:Sugar phosphate isomerase/epimerase n=1 Tax=Sphaerotilus hippei TaxID=744406 RepID=A0A318H200_9BURK|nr:TIM barrel protein [Sphaerotilus hippei]PXW97408.1 sugar phosphate isomerase/epimerase [Sphaerotilus hippei]
MKERLFSLAQLVALTRTPPQLLALAARTGCDGAGLRLLPSAPGGVHHPLMDDAPLLRETLAVLRDTGMRVFDLEVVRIGADFRLAHWQRFLAVGAQLQARHVLVAGDDPDEARLIEHFGALCDAARPFGLTADLEFMPWTAVSDLKTAARIVGAVGRDNAGLLIDALHFSRSSSTLDEVAALPPAWLHYVQVCDGAVPGPATVEGMIFDARCERLLPGEGAIALQALLARLPAGLPVSIEIPNEARARAMGHEAWAASCVQAARRVA